MSTYGPERVISDLDQMGFEAEITKDLKGGEYVLLRGFIISIGTFKDKVIDLAFPTPKDYPRTCGSSIHVRSQPHLLDKKDKLKGVRNIIDSPLGPDWRYWSFRFQLSQSSPTQDLMSQINGIFRRIERQAS